VAPLRVILNDGKTSEMLSLTNRSETAHTYKVTMQDQVMTDTGNVVAKDDFPYSAKRMLRFMPRQVTLAPGQRQNLRVMVTPPEGLAEGEYHTHLIFDEVIQETSSTQAKPNEGLKVMVQNQYSLGLPLIFQHGKVHGNVSLTNARLGLDKKGRPEFRVSLLHSGNGEASGLIKVMEKGGNGESFVIPRNTHLYRETDKVELALPLRDKLDFTLQGLQAKKLQVLVEREGAEPLVADVVH
jgi:hypothetical protein